MSKVGTFLKWFFAVLCLTGIGVYGFNIGAIIIFLVGIAALPIKPIREIWDKVIKDKKWIKPTVLAVLFCASTMLLPQDATATKDEEQTTEITTEIDTTTSKEDETTSKDEIATKDETTTKEETTTPEEITTKEVITTTKEPETTKKEEETTKTPVSSNSIPKYSGKAYVSLNDGEPYFTSSELTTKSYEFYSDLDSLGRCGVTIACIGKDIMPTEERGNIGQVKPTGWHTIKYDIVDGKYLYNRCHLIGYQLTGENANTKNLITGTRSMNVDGMLPFENMVADYVTETGNHVMYRVTPIFEGNNLLANGVLMEAKSVEDNGEGIEFCVFVYNVQDGIEIDYKTGDSHLKEQPTTTQPPTTTKKETTTKQTTNQEQTTTKVSSGGDNLVWISETGSKYHSKNDCGTMNPDKAYQITEEEAEKQGYEPCKRCH